MSRIAFASERPVGFEAWRRPLGLFVLKAFPYLCKSLRVGEVSLHGRFPQLQAAVTPSDARTRSRARALLDRVLQNSTTGKSLEFLGLSGKEELGGDGTAEEEDAALSFDGSAGRTGAWRRRMARGAPSMAIATGRMAALSGTRRD